MKWDAVLRDYREVRVSRIVEHRGGEESTRRRDETRRRSFSFLGRDYSVLEHTLQRIDFDKRVRVDVNIVLIDAGIGEEAFPKGSKLEIRVSKEEKGNFGATYGGGKAGFGRGEADVTAEVLCSVHGYSFLKERQVIYLITRKGESCLSSGEEMRC